MNHTAEITGDEAHTETYYVFVGTDSAPARPYHLRRPVHRPSGATTRPVGHRRPSLLSRVAERSQLAAPPEAIDFLDTVQTVARDASDTSYDRPLAVTRTMSNP